MPTAIVFACGAFVGWSLSSGDYPGAALVLLVVVVVQLVSSAHRARRRTRYP